MSPLISQFYGIIITMYVETSTKHHTPHIHAKYAEHKASISLDGVVLRGSLPSKQLKLVVAWLEIHREEVEALWDIMQTSGEHYRISGLI